MVNLGHEPEPDPVPADTEEPKEEEDFLVSGWSWPSLFSMLVVLVVVVAPTTPGGSGPLKNSSRSDA